MNKKQVGAFLKAMGKDDARQILNNAVVMSYNGEPCIVATNGRILAAVRLDDSATELIGRLIRRSALEKWYKLATGKSRLTGDELIAVSAEDYAQHNGYEQGEYPNWQGLIPTTEPQGQAVMRFNAEFFKIVQEIDGGDSIDVSLYGELKPMVFKSERGVYVVMPMKL